MMDYKGNLYPHKYKPLISKNLFDLAQKTMAGYHKKPFAYASKPFAFRGLIKCYDPACGCTITPETHRKNNYMSCTNSKGVHPERTYIKEEDLLAQVQKVITGLQMPEQKIEKTVNDLRKLNQSKDDFYKASITDLRKEHDQIETRISRMFDLRLDDQSITTEIFNKKLKEYKERQSELEAQMAQYTTADEKFYVNANMLLHILKQACEVFEGSEPATKNKILRFLLQNIKLEGKKLHFELKKPFVGVLQANTSNSLLRRLNDVRTYVLTQ